MESPVFYKQGSFFIQNGKPIPAKIGNTIQTNNGKLIPAKISCAEVWLF